MINNRYRLIKFLGSGRCRVFLCEDTNYYNRSVVLKVLPPDTPDYEKERFYSEFNILKGLSHPDIINVYSRSVILSISQEDEEQFAIFPGSEFIAMEYFEGGSLLDYDEVIDERILFDILIKLGSLLFYLHLNNYIYLDLKPENILFTFNENEPEIKLIDFGLCRENKTPEFEHTGGSSYYIAPEIIRGEIYDHRVDLYALGILMYRLAYGRFPFNTDNEIDIYRDHTDLEFSFPAGNISPKLTFIIRKLLEKNPLNRYHSTLQIFHDIDYRIISREKYRWQPVVKFFVRDSLFTAVKQYLTGEIAENSILVIKGGSSTSKSVLLEEATKQFPDSVLLRIIPGGNRLNAVNTFLYSFFYHKNVYPSLLPDIKEDIEKIISENKVVNYEKIRSMLSRTVSGIPGNILIDDYNLQDTVVRSIIDEIITFARVEGKKVALTENIEFPQFSSYLPETRVLNVTNMSNEEVEEYTDNTFAGFFPKQDITGIFIQNPNRYPAFLRKLYSGLVVDDIIHFTPSGPQILKNSAKLKRLLNKELEIFTERFEMLPENKREILAVIALIDSELNISKLSLFFRINPINLEVFTEQLSALGFLNYIQSASTVKFVSQQIRDLVRKSFNGIRSLHLKIAEVMAANLHDFSHIAVGDHYKASGNDNDALLFYEKELAQYADTPYYSHITEILERIISLDIPLIVLNGYQLMLSDINYKRSSFSSALDILNKLDQTELNQDQYRKYIWIYAKCKIKLGSPEEGLNLLLKNRYSISEVVDESELNLVMANAYFDLEKFTEAESLCLTITKKFFDDFNICGGAFNLLGLISYYRDNNLDKTKVFFEKAVEKYAAGNLFSKTAGMEVNLGNILNIRGESNEAVQYWNKAGETNRNTGNFEQEAKLQLSFGIYHFENHDFEAAKEKFRNSLKIFNGLGDRNGTGLAFVNLGEVQLNMCEYEEAEITLKKAKSVFSSINNSEELLESVFQLVVLYGNLGDKKKAFGEMMVFRELLSRAENDRHVYNGNFLENFLNLKFSEGQFTINKLNKNLSYYKNLDMDQRYSANILLLTRILIKSKKYDEALKLLDDEFLKSVVENYKPVKAEYLYLLSLSMGYNNKENEAFIYAESAMEIIEELNITPLTFEVSSLIGRLYYNRGNENKSEHYHYITKSLIEHFYKSFTNKKTAEMFISNSPVSDIINYLANTGIDIEYE